jgi:hypothetical protein
MTYANRRLDLTDTKVLLDVQEADQRSGYQRRTLAELDFSPDEVDFTDYVTRQRLSAQGLFSIDQKAKREAIAAEVARIAELEAAYKLVGLDRNRAHRRIAARLEGVRTGGVWATSTAEYANARDKLDALTLVRASLMPVEAVVDLRVSNHGSVLVFTLNTDAAADWVGMNLTIPDWSWLGHRRFGIDARLAEQIVSHAVSDGLDVSA